ncbi:MAG: hypothetical protein OES79_13895 [Planctomycetota bacterium]|nr:hypothetical protein [Planctomycetota bacterium]
MSSEPFDVGQDEVCPECGARRAAADKICWLCAAPLQRVTTPLEISARDLVGPPHIERFSFALSTVMLVITLASVCFGLLAVAPGLAVPMCVLLVPVFVRTMMVVRRREAAGMSVSPLQKVGLFLGSFAVATILSVVIAVAAFCSFCGVCLVVISGDSSYGGSETLLWGIGMCSAAAAAVVAIVFIFKWIRRRYQRDIRGE